MSKIFSCEGTLSFHHSSSAAAAAAAVVVPRPCMPIAAAAADGRCFHFPPLKSVRKGEESQREREKEGAGAKMKLA